VATKFVRNRCHLSQFWSIVEYHEQTIISQFTLTYITPWSYFFVSFGCFFGGDQHKNAVSTVIVGRLYCILFIRSSMTFGVMLIAF